MSSQPLKVGAHTQSQSHKQIIAALLQDPKFYKRVSQILDPRYFEKDLDGRIVKAFLAVKKHTSDHPIQEHVEEAAIEGFNEYDGMKGKRVDRPLTQTDIEILKEIRRLYAAPVQNLDYAVAVYREFVKAGRTSLSIQSVLGAFQDNQYDQCLKNIQEAIMTDKDIQLADDSFYDDPVILPPDIISGLLPLRGIGMLNSHSKAFKSWNAMALGIAVSMGKSWMGFPDCDKRRVLYVDGELENIRIMQRLDQVAKAMGTTRKALKGRLEFLPLAGEATDVDSIISYIRSHYDPANPWELIILDPVYCLYGETDGENVENNNAAMAAIFRKLRRMTKQLNLGLFMVHHFKKGNAGATLNIDSGSGAGVFGRAPDAILSMKPIKTDNETRAWKIESDLRYFSSPEPFAVRLGTGDDWPLLVRAPELDDAQLEGASGRPISYPNDDLLNLIPDAGIEKAAWKKLADKEYGISKSRFYEKVTELSQSGLIREENGLVYRDTGKVNLNSLRAKLNGVAKN